jgi:site-specific DNA-methyltransferase (cytosine-N4-specific)
VIRIMHGHALALLQAMPDASVQMVATSPPYWGLRDYGDPGCDWPEVSFAPMPGIPALTIPAQQASLGLESEPLAYIAHLVVLFREVRRVLADDGVLFLNLGDSYAGSWGNQGRKAERGTQRAVSKPMIQRFHAGNEAHADDCDMDEDCVCGWSESRYAQKSSNTGKLPDGSGLKNKDLIGIPWRAAFALQADGWYLRSDCIWSKPNPMPSSVRDRPTTAHEYVFVLSKSRRYFWDQEAVKEPDAGQKAGNGFAGRQGGARGLPMSGGAGTSSAWEPGRGRNLRSIWTIPTQPFPGAHFAVWPPRLAERCIKAGSRKGDTVLDPFSGAGTTGLVASRLGRSYIGLEQSAQYVEMAMRRIEQDSPLFNRMSS